MPKTLDELIQKEREQNQFLIPGEIELQLQENQAISSILEDESFEKSLEEGDLSGFKKEEVLAAAKYALRAKPYGIDVTHLNINDSPIYYDQKGKSRWFLTRKSLNDAAEAVLVKAQSFSRERKRLAKEAEFRREIDDLMKDLKLDQEIGKDIPAVDEKNLQEDEAYTEELKNSSAYNNLDHALLNTKAMSRMEDAMKLAEGSSSKDGMILDKSLKALDACLKNELPSPEELRRMIDEGMRTQIENYMRPQFEKENVIDKKKWVDKKKVFIKERNDLIKRFEKMYKEVKEGRISPDVLKVFLNSAIMANTCEKEHNIYASLVLRTEKYKEPTSEQNKEYRAILKGIGQDHYDMKQIRFQGIGTMKDYVKAMNHKYNKQTPDSGVSEKESFNLAFKEPKCFIHYRGKNLLNGEDCTDRCYITAQPGKQIELMKIWREVLNKPEYKDLVDNIHFKMNGNISEKRRDNIVIYLPRNVDRSAFDRLIKDVTDRCKEKQVLCDEKHTLPAASIQGGGISTGSEFDTADIYAEMIHFNLFCDKSLNYSLDRAINGKGASKGTKIPNFSYNSYIAKAMFYSAEILRTKLGLPRGKIIRRIKTDESAKRIFRKYFADFMKLGGVDPMTMKRSDKENNNENKGDVA